MKRPPSAGVGVSRGCSTLAARLGEHGFEDFHDGALLGLGEGREAEMWVAQTGPTEDSSLAQE